MQALPLLGKWLKLKPLLPNHRNQLNSNEVMIYPQLQLLCWTRVRNFTQ